ncbi:hypothetical protein NPIL_191321 [Nephila pilipes]|uniref:Uncharacterized protein n=1 Tax=Nephila pilipes TaxID=299642 RepID=A0A8X6NVD5_NEPPI|nr:hypothetical protein NPIL_191321 [Nephila pilipes]
MYVSKAKKSDACRVRALRPLRRCKAAAARCVLNGSRRVRQTAAGMRRYTRRVARVLWWYRQRSHVWPCGGGRRANTAALSLLYTAMVLLAAVLTSRQRRRFKPQ